MYFLTCQTQTSPCPLDQQGVVVFSQFDRSLSAWHYSIFCLSGHLLGFGFISVIVSFGLVSFHCYWFDSQTLSRQRAGLYPARCRFWHLSIKESFMSFFTRASDFAKPMLPSLALV